MPAYELPPEGRTTNFAFSYSLAVGGYALEIRRGIAQLHESLPAHSDVTPSLTLGELQRIIVHQTSFADSLKIVETKVEGRPEELERFFGFFDAPASEPPALTAR